MCRLGVLIYQYTIFFCNLRIILKKHKTNLARNVTESYSVTSEKEQKINFGKFGYQPYFLIKRMPFVLTLCKSDVAVESP